MTDGLRPPGHYPAEGDPPGTHRYWNGSAWVGGPEPISPMATAGTVAPSVSPPGQETASGYGASGYGAASNTDGYKGFFRSLVDFELSSFIAPKVIKVLYAVSMLLWAIFAVIYLGVFVAQGGVAIVAGLVVVPIVAFLYLIYIRIFHEFIMVSFRTYEELRRQRTS